MSSSVTITPTTPPVPAKRRLISSLPVSNQNPDLSAFFGATVDEVFQPGTSEPISGYIGHSITGSTDDFYVAESTPSRAFYQLEPGMVSFDAINPQTIDYALTYPDLVSYFSVNGSIVTDQGRMFETDYYAWSPPINIDMLVNYRHYYWFGDIDTQSETTYILNKADQTSGILIINSGLMAQTLSAFVPTQQAVRSTQIGAGLWYVEFTIFAAPGTQYCGIANSLDPLSPIVPGMTTSNNAVIYDNTGNVFNDTGTTPIAQTLAPYAALDIVGMAWSTFSRKVWFRVNGENWENAEDDPVTSGGGYDLTAMLAKGPACVFWSGMNAEASSGVNNGGQVSVNFGSSAFAFNPPTDFVGPASLLQSEDLPALTLRVPISIYDGDGVTTSFLLPPSILAVPQYVESPTAYVNNAEIGGTYLSQDGRSIILPFAPALLSTVMVCRTPDLAAVMLGNSNINVSDLNTVGVVDLTSTMRINIIDTSHLADAWDSLPWDSTPVPIGWQPGAANAQPGGWDATNDALYMVDGVGTSLRLTPLSNMVRGLAAQYVTIDRSSLDSNAWSVRNSWVHEGAFDWSSQQFPTRQATRPIIEFIRDIVLYPNQIWSESADPLFMLYDLNENALNTKVIYPHSTFGGNRIFGFAAGSGPNDPVLLRPLSYDNNGYIIFSNDAASIQYNYLVGTPTPISTPITGLNCYATNNETLVYFPFWHIAANTTIQGQTNGLYNIPVNLQANPDYEEVNLISKATWLDHFNAMIVNQIGYVGTSAGDTNYRDTARNLTLGNSILQHHAPMLKTMMLAASTFDLPRAIRYAELEYSRFRNKFARKLVDLRNKGTLLDTDLPSLWVSTVLASLKIGHNNQFPFALSGMAGGQYFIPPTPTGLCMQAAALPALITDTSYGSSKLMLLGHDGSLSLTFGDWRDGVMLQLETVIYENLPQPRTTFDNRITPGNGSFLDNSGNIYTIDAAGDAIENGVPIPGGSGTSAMQFFNALVYAQDAGTGSWYTFNGSYFTPSALPPPVNREAGPVFNIQSWIGGRFYTPYQGYSNAEVTSIMAPMFELWAQINRLDYRTNSTYNIADPFTWNYNGILDSAGNALPGNWRGIYNYYYDTDAPHTRPWEMLGFIGEPTWWASIYGNPPYTLSNIQLWIDLQGGIIVAGTRAGADARYARPGLLNFIPVDIAGNLLNPVQIGIVLTTVTPELAARDWVAGDGGPAETLWNHSPSSRFALATASFLMKPARCVEQCWDALGIGYVNGQWVELDSLLRPRNAVQYVHGEVNPTLSPPAAANIIGISQWLTDYLVSVGRQAGDLGTAIRGLNVALIHPMAGFTSIQDVQLVADSFGLLPAEDVQCVLYTSPAVDIEVYSGVIIQWTGASWSVVGFDGRNPNFTTIPPNVTGTKGMLSLAAANEPAIVPWRSGTYYPYQILVDYQNSVYQCARSHTSGINFELNYWTPRADLATSMIRAPRVITYDTGMNTTVTVPYGTEFTSYQDVADFLLGWQRWLVQRGWSFTNLNPNNQVLDFSLSVMEFLSWAQVQWAPGNFIAVSPGQAQLQFNAPQGTILNVEDNVTGFYGLIDRAGAPISQRDAVISRLDGNITISANNADIFLARLEICNIEHALIPSNVTIFDDDVYLPLFDLRQERLQLSCNRAYGWAGRLDAAGFIINSNGTLSSSFEKAATDVTLMFDIEYADVDNLRNYARHNIGMQQRSYLNDLLLGDTAQFEFYQGMIQEKGTPAVFQALARSNLATGNTTLLFLEEWAFRIATYGAPRDPFVTFQLSQSDTRDDPQLVRFETQAGTPLDWIELATAPSAWSTNTYYTTDVLVTYQNVIYQCIANNTSGQTFDITSWVVFTGIPPADDPRWYDKPQTPSQFFIERDDYAAAVLPTAGPVRLSEVQGTAFDIPSVVGLYVPITYNYPTGTLLWVYNTIPLFEGTNWYVDAYFGDDNNTGLSTSTALATLQQAHDQSNPGDIINVAAGTYTAAGLGSNVLEITRSGIASAPITYRAMSGTVPLIFGAQSYATVHFNAVAYIIFQGFEIAGWNASLLGSLHDIQALPASVSTVSNLYNGSGIVIDRGTGMQLSHHITVLDCQVHDFPYNGILVNWADYITIQGCTVYGNSRYSVFAGSGINILNSHGIDNISTYKTYVQQNICHNNINCVLNVNSQNITDGCGITIAGNLNDYTDGIGYNGRTLVQNNLVYNNGGIGIQINDSQHVDTIFNTAYCNQSNTNYAFGEIAAYSSIDCNIFNNILDTTSSVPLATSTNNLDTFYSNNIGFGGNGLPVPGVSSLTDPLFVNPVTNASVCTASDTTTSAPPNFNLRQGSYALRSANPLFSTTCDLVGNLRSADTGYDIGCYQRETTPAPVTGWHPYTVLKSFDIGNDNQPNEILVVTTVKEDPTVTTMRISFQIPMTLGTDDVGNYLIIDGLASTSPEIQGVQQIIAVYPAINSVDIVAVGTAGSSFLNNLVNAPVVRVLRSVRFATINAINPNYNFNAGDLVWIDAYTPSQWAVLQWDGTEWNLYRVQPHRIDATTIGETVIYKAGAQIVNQQMILNQPVVDDVVVIDALCGLICNLAKQDIEFTSEFDPASYNAGSGPLAANVWGVNEVGRVWWNIATVRFLDTFTDTLGITPARDLAELTYRLAYWSTIAPGSSIDVYEWTESTEAPDAYIADVTNTGTVFDGGAAWVERTAYDTVQQQDVTLYYFWVSGSTLVPNVSFRHISVSQMAIGIENPSAMNISWMSAISPDALLVSGVTQYLDETSTVMKVRLISSPDNVGHHDQWLLLRPGDETSLPPDFLWAKVRDDLAGFQVAHSYLLSVPDPTLTAARNTGIDDGQSMFNVSTSTIPPWQAGVIYYFGDQVSNNGLAYQCTADGISAGIPYLLLNNGQNAVYSSGSGTTNLVFIYSGLYTTPLAVSSLNANSGTVTDLLGNAATLNGASVTISSRLSLVITVTVTFPQMVNVVIGAGPSGYSDTIIDGTAMWAYHGVDGSRSGLLAARAAFVGSVNNIFAQTAIKIDRAALLATIYRTTPYPNVDLPYLVWAQIDPSYPYEPPPSNEWEYEVYTVTQRNDLLASDAFLQAEQLYASSGINTPISILLSGFANTIPQWSIWEYNPEAAYRVCQANYNLTPTAALLQNADLVFGLKTAYDYVVASETARNALTGLVNLDRVLVTGDTDDYWAIWQWINPDPSQGGYFNLWRVQTYDTSAFIEDADWYDTVTLAENNFSVGNPPIIVYNTVAQRDLAEGSNPTNLLVNVLNTDTTNNFTWTAFIAGQWQTVAIQNATVQLSANFYDPSRSVYAVSTVTSPMPLSLSNVGVQDGSWSLYILVHALRYTGLLLESEINQLWFDMVNFVHVQQNEVDWAFKTSFMTLAGIAAPMTQTAVQTLDQTSDVIDYINEVKPYRVKLRETTTQYVPATDIANYTVTDFDDPVYVDPISGQRPLDPTNAADIVILQGASDPWTQWYQNYALPVSPVRSIIVTMLFDRIVGTSGNWDMSNWDVIPWDDSEADNGAAFRIATYYEPTSGMPPLDLVALLGLNEKENQISGVFRDAYIQAPVTPYPTTLLTGVSALGLAGSFTGDDGGTLIPETYSIDINPPLPSQPGGFDLRAPYDASNHPEERVVFGADDSLVIQVTANPLAGGCPQIVKVFDLAQGLPGLTTTLFIDLLPHSASAVMVFCDGYRAVLGTDYTVDYFNRAVILNLTVNNALVSRAVLHVFSFGGTSAISEQHYLTYGTNALTLNAASVSANVLAVVNGTPVAAAGVSVSGTAVTLTSPPAAGADVALLVYAGGAATAAQINVQTLGYTASQIWTLAHPDLVTVPPHAGTIVELNGYRLTPPTTFYGSMNIGTPWMYLPLMPDITTAVTVYVNNVLYTASIPIAIGNSTSSPYPFGLVLPGQPPSTSIAGQFVLYNNLLVALDPLFISSNVIITMEFSLSPPDYTVSTAGVLTIIPGLSSNAEIVVTTFNNAGCMGIQTVAYAVGAAEQHIVPLPFAESYALVTMNGHALVQEDDYTISDVQFATGDAYFNANVISIINPVETGNIVVTAFTGSAARELMMWLYTTVTPASNRMFPAPPPVIPNVAAGWDATALDSQAYDDAEVKGLPTNGPQNPAALYSIQGRFESIRLSPYMAGTLVADLAPNDASFSINLFVQSVAVKLQDTNPLPIPDNLRDKPGAVWIEGERIEYFGYARTGNVVTLSALRRATRGTSMGPKRLVLTATGDGTSHVYTFNEPGVVDVQFNDIGQPSSAFFVSGATIVTLTAPIGMYVVIGLTIAASHVAGADVWNGKQIFLEDIPLGPPVGNRELQPMHRIING
jgi:hypothetical protein